jgi:hypothetical protein
MTLSIMPTTPKLIAAVILARIKKSLADFRDVDDAELKKAQAG